MLHEFADVLLFNFSYAYLPDPNVCGWRQLRDQFVITSGRYWTGINIEFESTLYVNIYNENL